MKKAKEDEEETAVMEQMTAKALMLFRIGHKEEALAVIKEALSEKHVSTGQKIDLELKCVRIALFHSDTELMKEHIELCNTLIEEGGDWDRRNRLKIYDGAYRMLVRDFSTAADNFMSSIATFTSYEVMDYKCFIQRTCYLGLFHLSRSDLKKKVINSPDVNQVVREDVNVKDFVESFYNCDYKTFNQQLLNAHKRICRDRLMAPHMQYYLKEMRVRSYNQFLDAYKSVKIASMAEAFGVSVDFIDGELFRFISMGRLNAKIDKTAGVIETNRPDAKNAQYQDVIKHGDALLNRIQQLARVLN
jgi:26S proteasome regulatory subunit N7